MKTVKTSGTALIAVLILAVIAYFVLRKRQDNSWILQLAQPSSSVAEAT